MTGRAGYSEPKFSPGMQSPGVEHPRSKREHEHELMLNRGEKSSKKLGSWEETFQEAKEGNLPRRVRPVLAED